MRRVDVVRTYLALDTPSQFRAPRNVGAKQSNLVRHSPCPLGLYRRLYREVGEQWFWHDRLEWSDTELAEHLSRPNIGVWELTVDGNTAGFFELQLHDDGSVEIVYFGLLPDYFGHGLGAAMLESAVHEGWAMGATRVWLHTCSLDSNHALPNYKARGFREYKTERLEVDIEGMDVVGERLLHD